MHHGFSSRMPTPRLSGQRTARPGPARVCLCVLFLAGSGGPASWARSRAPHVSFGRVVLLLFWATSGLGLPLSCPLISFRGGFCFLFFWLLLPLRPRCLVLSSVSGPGCLGPWRVRSPCRPGPAPLVFFCLGPFGLLFVAPRPPFPLCISLPLFLGGLRRAVLLLCSDPPGPGLPFACPVVFVLSFRGGFFFLLLLRPRCLVLSSVSGPVCLGPLRCPFFLPPPPVSFSFVLSPSAAVWLVRPLLPPALVSLLSFPLFWFSLFSGGGLRCLPPLVFFGGGLPLLGSLSAPAAVVFAVSPLSVSLRLLPRPPLVCVSRFSSCFRSASCGFPPLCCSCLLAFGSHRLPPPRCARCSLDCPVSLCCAALPSGALRCCVAVFRAACPGVVSHFSLLWAATRCVLLFVPRSGLLLRAVPRLWSCRPAALFALWFAFRICCAFPCAVACGVLGCCAAPRCSALCGAVVCYFVVFRSFRAAACCVSPWGAVCRPGVLRFPALRFVVFPRAVCSVLCVICRGVVVHAVVRCCALCCGCPGVSCCGFPVLPALCGALLRCAGVLALCCLCGPCRFRRPVLWCIAVCCAVACGVLWRDAGSGCQRWSAGGAFRCRCPCLAAWLASLWQVWIAAVPCSPLLCSVVLCCLVVLCCRAMLYFCGAVCSCCFFSP